MSTNQEALTEKKINTTDKVFKDVNAFVAHRYLDLLFIWTGLFISLVLIFIWIIDPYGVSPLQIKISGINIYKPQRLDIDRLIKPYEVWRYQPKTIFMGTSRMHQSMDPAIFDGTEFAPAYNAAIPASTLAENAEHIEQFLKLDHNLKHIFIELFLYNFTGQGQESTPKTWTQFFSDYVSLQMSSNALVDTIKTVAINRKIDRKKIPISGHITKGGYRIHASDFNPADTFGETLFMRNVVSWEHAGKMSLHTDALKTLDRIVEITRRHGVQLHLILTPNYPWDDYRLVTLGYWPLVEEWMRKIATYANVVSFSQYNNLLIEAPTHNPKMKWWNDPTHFSLSMGRNMLKAYLGHPTKDTPTNFMRSLTPQTVESIIAERHAGVLNWASSHPDFVENFEDAKSRPEKVSGTLDTQRKILSVNGHNYPIVLGVGKILFTSLQGNTLTATGWTIDEVAKRPAKQLIATIGSSVVAQSYAIVKNPEIEATFGKAILSGFNIDVPLLNWWRNVEPIRVFALMRDGRAVQIASEAKLIDGIPIIN